MTKKGSCNSGSLLKVVINHYLVSGDFNGFYVGKDDKRWGRSARALIKRGDLEVIDESIFPNPHIRPWSNPKLREEQIASLDDALVAKSQGICLYPTAQALADNPVVTRLGGEPYTQKMAQGAGALDLAYFRFDVLEGYRNDPTFSFDFDDFGVCINVTDDAYLDKRIPEDEKISLRLGFAYQLPLNENGAIVRRACVFLTDLAKLTSVHQRRWHTYEVSSNGLNPHPVWWTMQMGEWPDGVGPFDGLMYELKTWDELHVRAFNGVHLLKTTERPSGFGWVMRPSQKEFDDFVQDLDKLLSENLRHQAFDYADVSRKDDTDHDYGTLKRLDLFLVKSKIEETARKKVLQSLRDVRDARSKPAHDIRKNITDENFVRRQAELLQDIRASIHQLRLFWQTHPKNKDWQEHDNIKDSKYYWL